MHISTSFSTEKYDNDRVYKSTNQQHKTMSLQINLKKTEYKSSPDKLIFFTLSGQFSWNAVMNLFEPAAEAST